MFWALCQARKFQTLPKLKEFADDKLIGFKISNLSEKVQKAFRDIVGQFNSLFNKTFYS